MSLLVRRVASFTLAAGLLGALPACSESGQYKVSWRLEEEFSAASCGKHGVASIAFVELQGGAPVGGAVFPCSLGKATRAVAPGRYSVLLSGRDSRGLDKEPPGSMFLHSTIGEVVVAEDGTADLGEVMLAPQPECRDGVDNDCDGRVDLVDSACSSPDVASETAAGEEPSCGAARVDRDAAIVPADARPDANGDDAGSDGAGGDGDGDAGSDGGTGEADADPDAGAGGDDGGAGGDSGDAPLD
jgi:hypothetical protein